jgi:colicin import membrane protein
MLDFVKQHWTYILGALLLHAFFAGIFGLTMLNMQRDPPPVQLAIQAVIVDPSALNQSTRQQQQRREREREQAAQKEREQQAQREREREQAAEQQRREQQETVQKEAEQRAEQERQVELKQRQEAEQQRVAEEQQLRERQETERKRADAEAVKKRQAEEEQKRVAEIERKQKEAAERKRAADEARSQEARESELKRQLEEEEGTMQARGSPAMAQYVAMLQQHVERRWNRPLSTIEGLSCEVRVAQTPAGVVLSVQVGQCNGDAAVKQSIETAVLRSSPLPPPPDPRMFERNLVFLFKPTS